MLNENKLFSTVSSPLCGGKDGWQYLLGIAVFFIKRGQNVICLKIKVVLRIDYTNQKQSLANYFIASSY